MFLSICRQSISESIKRLEGRGIFRGAPDAVRDGVCRELRDFAKPLSKMRQMFREDFALDVAAYPCRGEIRAGADKRGHFSVALGEHSRRMVRGTLFYLLSKP